MGYAIVRESLLPPQPVAVIKQVSIAVFVLRLRYLLQRLTGEKRRGSSSTAGNSTPPQLPKA